MIWDTDSNGYETANPIGIVSGNSPALEALEPSFHQDLNGDGVIGVPSGTSLGPSGTAPQGAMVSVMNNDTFVFGAAGAAGAPIAGSANIGVGGAPLLFGAAIGPSQDANVGRMQALFEAMKDGHDFSGIPDAHGSAPVMDFHSIDPLGGHFIIR